MMYLANQIPRSNNEAFRLVDNFVKDSVSLIPNLCRVDLVLAIILN